MAHHKKRRCTAKSKKKQAVAQKLIYTMESIETKLPNEVLGMVFEEVQSTESSNKSISKLRLISKHVNGLVTPIKYRNMRVTKRVEESFQDAVDAPIYKTSVAENIRKHTRHILLDRIYKQETWEELCLLEKLEEIIYVCPKKCKADEAAKATGYLCKLLLCSHDLTRLSIASGSFSTSLVTAITHQGESLRKLHIGASGLVVDSIDAIRLSCPNLVELGLEDAYQEQEPGVWLDSVSLFRNVRRLSIAVRSSYAYASRVETKQAKLRDCQRTTKSFLLRLIQEKQGAAFDNVELATEFHTLRPVMPNARPWPVYIYYVGHFNYTYEAKSRQVQMEIGSEICPHWIDIKKQRASKQLGWYGDEMNPLEE